MSWQEFPEVVARIERCDEWLTESADVPKLLLAFDPGGAGGHHTPEDQPDAIAAAISS